MNYLLNLIKFFNKKHKRNGGMKKFYVSSGSNKNLVMAITPIQAATIVFDKWMRQGVEEVNGLIKVSEIGFDDHLEDTSFSLYDVLMLVRKNNKFKEKKNVS